mgnify:CR=1 FL=1
MHELTQKEYQELLLEHSDFKHNIEDLQSRMEKCETQQEAMNSLTRSVDRLAITMGNMVEEHKELKKEVKSIKEAPADNYKYYKRTIISCIITAVVSAIVGAIMSLIIIGGGA